MGADARRYAVPAAHVPVLLDVRSPLHTMGAPTMFTGVATTFDAVVEAFASGDGVSFSEFGPGVRHGLEIFNRPAYTNDLSTWLREMPDVAERLADGGTILDAGCGTGWSTVALAEVFPRAHVVGIDLDDASITEAQEHAAESGVSARVRFVRADAGDAEALRAAAGGTVKLVTVFEALHDMLDPQRVLAALASLLDEGGAILVGDEQVADEFTAPADFLDRLNYAFSVLHCLPATIAEGKGEANGTVLRAPTLQAWATGRRSHRIRATRDRTRLLVVLPPHPVRPGETLERRGRCLLRPPGRGARGAAGSPHPGRGSRGRPRGGPSTRRHPAAWCGTGRRSRA